MNTTTPNTNMNGSFSTAKEFLASLHNDRSGTLDSLTTSPFRIMSEPVNVQSFWQLFDASVLADGNVDVNTLFGPSSGPDVQSAVDPVTIALAALTLCLSAFGAGYLIGKDAANTQDEQDQLDEAADDEAAGENTDGNEPSEGDGSSSLLGEQSTMTFEPSQRGIAVRVFTSPVAAGANDISDRELLAGLKTDRTAIRRRLRTHGEWRVVMDPISSEEIWAFIDSSISPDGTIEIGALEPSAESRTTSEEPVFLGALEVLFLVGSAMLCSGALGVLVGYEVNDNEQPGSDTEDADTEATDQTNDGSSGTGDNGTGDAGDSGQGEEDHGGAGYATAVLRPGELGAVDLTVHATPTVL